jgi:hypothetical protein
LPFELARLAPDAAVGMLGVVCDSAGLRVVGGDEVIWLSWSPEAGVSL